MSHFTQQNTERENSSKSENEPTEIRKYRRVVPVVDTIVTVKVRGKRGDDYARKTSDFDSDCDSNSK